MLSTCCNVLVMWLWNIIKIFCLLAQCLRPPPPTTNLRYCFVFRLADQCIIPSGVFWECMWAKLWWLIAGTPLIILVCLIRVTDEPKHDPYLMLNVRLRLLRLHVTLCYVMLYVVLCGYSSARNRLSSSLLSKSLMIKFWKVQFYLMFIWVWNLVSQPARRI
jgi:hypothetical protein